MPYFPPIQSVADFPVSKCIDILRKAAGLPRMQVDIKTVETWSMSAQVAAKFQVCSSCFAGLTMRLYWWLPTLQLYSVP